jgi:hypothetical protein
MTTTFRARWTCRQCQANNSWIEKVCEACGQERGVGTQEPAAGRACLIDGGMLDARGWCRAGDGYPIDMKCPFVCPLCRAPLSWSGGCDTCKGTGTPAAPRERWAFPGDRYEIRLGHYVKVDGPRRACSVEENKAGLARVRAVLAGAPILEAVDPPPAPRRRRGVIGWDAASAAIAEARRQKGEPTP